MSDNKLVMLHFSCACGQVNGSVQVPPSSLPLPLTFCHCNTCRHQTGLLAASCVKLPKNHEEFKVNGPTTSYEASEHIARHFCRNCGTNLYMHIRDSDEISLCSGILADSGDQVRLVNHIFVTDTKDGGMSSWLPALPAWEGCSKESKQVDCSRQSSTTTTIKTTTATPQEPSELQGHCQCKTFQFKISRPNEKSSDLRGPYADLFVPYVSTPLPDIENRDDVKWWLRRRGTKYLAGNCACPSCRKNSGYDIQAWAFIPRVNLLDTQGQRLELDLDPNTTTNTTQHSLAEYSSSDGVHRYFCRECGATVFWRCEGRPDLIDVSVGLLDAEEGARAETWLEWWTDRVSFEEEAPIRALIDGLKGGLKGWAEQKTGKGESV